MELTKQEKKELISLAHKLRPVVTIGNKGLTDNVQSEIALALRSHGLLKIKVLESDREARVAMVEAICEEHQAALVQSIGFTLTVFRPKAEASTSAANQLKRANKLVKPCHRKKKAEPRRGKPKKRARS
jgi:RNA-binding protein